MHPIADPATGEAIARTLTSVKSAPVSWERHVRSFDLSDCFSKPVWTVWRRASRTVHDLGESTNLSGKTLWRTSTLAHRRKPTCHFGRATWFSQRSRDEIRECARSSNPSPPLCFLILTLSLSLSLLNHCARFGPSHNDPSGANVAAIGRSDVKWRARIRMTSWSTRRSRKATSHWRPWHESRGTWRWRRNSYSDIMLLYSHAVNIANDDHDLIPHPPRTRHDICQRWGESLCLYSELFAGRYS